MDGLGAARMPGEGEPGGSVTGHAVHRRWATRGLSSFRSRPLRMLWPALPPLVPRDRSG
jgi:hypothetical protein